MPKLKIAIVTTYPPGKGSLNEYAYHFVRYLRHKPEVSEILLFTDDLPAGQSYPDERRNDASAIPTNIIPCWHFNACSNPIQILNVIKKHRPDVVLFNLQFASFGDRKIPAML